MGFRNLGFRVSVEEIGKWISMSKTLDSPHMCCFCKKKEKDIQPQTLNPK